MKKKNGQKYVPERIRRKLSQGYIIRTLRELKGWTQEKLSKECGIAATNISMLEHERLELGKERAIKLARALGVHPATLMFPDITATEFLKAA